MADPLWINEAAPGGPPAYSANEMRQAMSLGLMYGGRNMGARAGVRPGGNQLSVSLAGSTITVQPGVCCLDPALSTPQGPYWVAIPVAENPGPLAAADATNPRKDIVIARVYDHDEDASGLRFARTEYLVGTPNPSPAEPAVPAGSIKLALIDVPASPGTPVVTIDVDYTVASGGILPVQSAGDIVAAVEGRYRDRLDINLLERDSGAAWETIADPAAFKQWDTWTPVWSTSGTAQSLGDGALVGKHKRIGETEHFFLRLTWGTTTSGGTGDWRFTLPVNPNFGNLTVFGNARDSSADFAYPLAPRVQSTSPGIPSIGAHNATGAIGKVSATHPFAWAVNDVLTIQGTFPVSA